MKFYLRTKMPDFLIADVVTHTSANLYYYHDIEITVQKALDIWHKAQGRRRGRERVLQRVLPGFFKGICAAAVRITACIYVAVFSKGYS